MNIEGPVHRELKFFSRLKRFGKVHPHHRFIDSYRNIFASQIFHRQNLIPEIQIMPQDIAQLIHRHIS